MRFVDTNVLLYSVSTDPHEESKAFAAAQLLDAVDLALSVQVLQEFYVNATRSRNDGLTHDEAVAFIAKWLRFPVQEMSVGLMTEAFAASERWRVSYWDAAIIEAARLLGCTQILTEDLNPNQDFDGVRVANPFAT